MIGRASRRWLAGGGIFLCFLTGAAAAPSADGLGYTPPAPGSYVLQRIQGAGDGKVLDTRGRPRRLREFVRGRVSLLTFIYSSCADPAGCPYAYLVFNQVRDALEADPSLHGKVRLVSLSFDPVRDTPEVLALYGGADKRKHPPVPWDFLTTASVDRLLPVLDAYGQNARLETDPATGKPSGAFSHVLKVFLIDAEGMVREIYTTAFLHPRVVINDIRTLLMEATAARRTRK